jgi:pyruvate carboxylase subunit B
VFYEFAGNCECSPCLEPFVGQEYKEGDTFCYIQAKWGEIVPIPAALGGKLVEVSAKQGARVRRGDTLGWIERKEQ